MKKQKWESWKQRIGIEELDTYEPDIWDRLGGSRLWITISASDEDTEMETEDSDEGQGNHEPRKPNFNQLSPGKKFKLIKQIAKPQNTIYQKNGAVAIQVTETEAEQLLTLTEIVTEIKAFKVKIEKHPFKNRVRGEIKNFVTIESTADELVEGLSEYGCVSVYKQEKPKRDTNDRLVKNREGNLIFVPSGKVVITLEKEVLPSSVNLFGLNIPVTQHEPDPLRCKNCFDYKHTKNYCPQQTIPICGWCSGRRHTERGERCENEAKCRHCEEGSNNHSNLDKNCPKWIKEKEIAKVKEIRKTNYFEAKKIVEQRVSQKVSSESEWEKKLNNKDKECEAKIEQIKAQCEQSIHNITQSFNTKLNDLTQEFNEQIKNMTVTITQQMQVITHQLQALAPQTVKSDNATVALQELKNTLDKQTTALTPPLLASPNTSWLTAQNNLQKPTFFSGGRGSFEEVPNDIVNQLTTQPPDPKKQRKNRPGDGKQPPDKG